MKIGTRVIRAGLPEPEQGKPFSEGVWFASVYHAAGEPSSSHYTYGRYHNPTWERFERALSELEGGIALSFASGMAAVAAVFGVVLRLETRWSCLPTVITPLECWRMDFLRRWASKCARRRRLPAGLRSYRRERSSCGSNLPVIRDSMCVTLPLWPKRLIGKAFWLRSITRRRRCWDNAR